MVVRVLDAATLSVPTFPARGLKDLETGIPPGWVYPDLGLFFAIKMG